ncbi:3-deoxy-7-phosphoheptulonate synthase [Candidatus Peregrinibacteria bacterium CG10_big_fil_rev_8_21_14_0_10_49_24]|nr:MAG: 3-deoxy-7-phosphoheptulonate synthase [Candidatus Peregrinibacteria bacterium CG11_big_fil_rev_8_21_14_0_20_49_14]PIR50893.1 MAG: 3-deoxy-7-phosphoheptulonate synthase [Candidatus Peregrinibacteria bacterium CG10_big_fil_rev_8_21_14_0_10_49_24]PJA67170.1 MAG: 3-deoxy-7-phosphoheptulonate synthase [Candidatus Peregrinibacteria bacterium CG_4_9_14_3_um_filter_49_12]
MLVKFERDHTPDQVEAVCSKIASVEGLRPDVDIGAVHTIITVVGEINGRCETLMHQIQAMPGVAAAERIGRPYQLAARKDSSQHTVVDVGNGIEIGGGKLAIVAGPCSIESEEQLRTIAEGVSRAGAHILRGGAFKPRTNPRSFEGLKEDGLKMLRDIGGEFGMPTQTEVMEPGKVDVVADHADILQIGTRNMQNYDLLKAVGQTRKPVVLKRGMSAKIPEWLSAAEYILDGGNKNVILCERGIRTFDDTMTRNTADVAAIPVLKHESHLPTMFDPSHAVGKTRLVSDVALAGVAAGADSIHVEVHHKPEEALSDGQQSLRIDQFEALMQEIQIMEEARRRIVQMRQR